MDAESNAKLQAEATELLVTAFPVDAAALERVEVREYQEYDNNDGYHIGDIYFYFTKHPYMCVHMEAATWNDQGELLEHFMVNFETVIPHT